jgi:DNA-binding winged helix-turn-helix (wHTH) protein/tetratricopeptide (TPR) repeat protein
LVYLFDKYELDDENFILLRQGERIALEPQSFRVLLFMVRNPGRLLEKTAILEAVWKGTFVEDSTLTRAVTLIRKQLGEDRRDPKFIETVPTKGYRFIAPVEVLLASKAKESSRQTYTANPGTIWQTTPPEIPLQSDAGSTARKRSDPRRVKVWLSATFALLLITVGVWRFHFRSRLILQPRDTVVLNDFANSTGDPVLDDTLRQGMAVQLRQSPILNLIPDPQIRKTLLLMGQPADAKLTPETGREICERTGSAVSLDGSVARNGNQYVLGLRATNCRTDEVFWSEQVHVSRREELLDALDTMASKFRRRIGESRDSVRNFDTPLAEAATPSLEALKTYTTANKVFSSQGSLAALPLYRRATELDPQFASAYSTLGRIYGDVGEEALSTENAANAYRFRERASGSERFFIEANYQMQVTGNLEKAQEICETWKHVYPRDPGPYGFSSGIILRVFGRYEKAAAEARTVIEILPDFGMGYHLLAIHDVRLGLLDEAEQVTSKATERKLLMPDFWMDRYWVAFLRRDRAAMQRAATMAATQPGSESIAANREAATLAYEGHLKDARILSQRAVDLAKQESKTGLAARFEVAAALRAAFFENSAEARVHAQQALQLSNDRDSEYGAAFALALTGELSESQALADDLERRFPEDTSVRFQYLPSLRALLELRHDRASRAIDLLQNAVPYELGFPQNTALATYGALYSIYVRGLAYLALDRGAEAATEFEKIVDHPGVTLNDPVGALARLQLARAYWMAGDKQKAKAAYDGMLELWKGSDPDLRPFEQAAKENRKL